MVIAGLGQYTTKDAHDAISQAEYDNLVRNLEEMKKNLTTHREKLQEIESYIEWQKSLSLLN
jgi:hypothetical protein